MKLADSNKDILEQYLSILTEFKRDKDIQSLTKYRGIYARASEEGASADFTEVSSFQFGDKHQSLAEYFDEFEVLIKQYYEL